jgi:hypothetical protein
VRAAEARGDGSQWSTLVGDLVRDDRRNPLLAVGGGLVRIVKQSRLPERDEAPVFVRTSSGVETVDEGLKKQQYEGRSGGM